MEEPKKPLTYGDVIEMSHEAKRILTEHKSLDAKIMSLETRLAINEKLTADILDIFGQLLAILKEK